ncbi:MAG: U32 family peptidase, partial [Acidimicrobiales bacterium]|nr:U32 family peptidase [Acidimicrobiales bacterium]
MLDEGVEEVDVGVGMGVEHGRDLVAPTFGVVGQIGRPITFPEALPALESRQRAVRHPQRLAGQQDDGVVVTGRGEVVGDLALVGEDARRHLLVDPGQLRVQEARRTGEGHHDARLGHLDGTHDVGELRGALLPTQRLDPFGRVVVHERVPRRTRPLQRQHVDGAAELGVDAVILADVGLLDYASRRHPALRLHLSVQGSATSYEAVNFAHREFGIRRAVLPRVLTVKEIGALVERMGVEAEVFAFGSLGTMTEGRCILSSNLTGRSPSSDGVCAPAEHVSLSEEDGEMVMRLGPLTMNRFGRDEPAGYPTPCKARLVARGIPSYLFDEPVGLNMIELLPELKAAGVTALKIEGR